MYKVFQKLIKPILTQKVHFWEWICHWPRNNYVSSSIWLKLKNGTLHL